ncbi:MAG: AAA family ATPase [Hyphomicrobiales bacterium]
MASVFSRLFDTPDTHIDTCITQEMKPRPAAKFTVQTKQLPGYRFVDVFNGVEAFAGTHGHVRRVETEHQEDLNSILHGARNDWTDRRIKRSTNTAWPVGPDEQRYLPVDCFWMVRGSDADTRVVLRVRYIAYMQQVELEVACEDQEAGEACLNRIVTWSGEHSIYRNRILQLSFEAGTKDEYGDVESIERLRVLFRPDETVGDDDIVMDDDVLKILWRNVIDLHQRREILKQHKVPVRRGVLLYGPPGTGKTYACRYLCGKLAETTRIMVTGTALTQVGAIFSLARLLQPALLILEDVDLIFASREINLYSTALGDLLDQMDGLRPYEDIGVILTTNAIDRLEAAIKDRPGRVSQCIYMAPPNRKLRQRYLERYLRDYDTSRLTSNGLVEQSDGTTQAFLKEWVHRSVQIATERVANGADTLELDDSDFSLAMDEMKQFSEGTAGQIIGFFSPRAEKD